ncbi:MAG: hypothetical protein RLZZ08_542 [Pseudomonadota bacterium]|jgi:hypothetical protein
MDRRSFLTSAVAAAGIAAVPTRVFAQVAGTTPRDRQILAVAQREVARAGNALWMRDVAAIADFSTHSSQPRFHFANLENGTVDSYLVAHGQGSDHEHDGWLKTFSNQNGSNATSRGAYATWEWYEGKYGVSVRLGGLDPDNSEAFDRAIVLHHADYATKEHVLEYGKLGRSNGCFAMSPADFSQALLRLSGGRLIYADRLEIA